MAAKKPYTGVEAQRYVPGDGWCPCEPHRADKWAAIWKDRILSRYPTRGGAQAMLDAQAKRMTTAGHGYKLGKRMEKRT